MDHSISSRDTEMQMTTLTTPNPPSGYGPKPNQLSFRTPNDCKRTDTVVSFDESDIQRFIVALEQMLSFAPFLELDLSWVLAAFASKCKHVNMLLIIVFYENN